MKKSVSLILAVVMIAAMFATFCLNASASGIEYSDHMQGSTSYEITDTSIAWTKQAKGALIWVPSGDTRSESEIIEQAKAADPSLANACNAFAVLKGEGVKYTPNTNGSKAKITVAFKGDKLYFDIVGNYSHFVKGVGGLTEESPAVITEPTEGPEEEGEKIVIRVDTAKGMAVKFEDGNVYNNGDYKEVVVGKEYPFQMISKNWDEGEDLLGTVVYRAKVVHKDEFNKLREEALKNPDRYTVKGMDIIDNESKLIVINCDAGNFHLETDVNNFFMAYRFHFKNGDYNKQTGIENVVETPLESLSVNLPLGTTVTAYAYKNYEQIDTDNILICNNTDNSDVYLTSVNDYYWNH